MDGLKNALYKAHMLAAIENGSLSREVFLAVTGATGDPVRGVIAALSSFGVGSHGPLRDARFWLFKASERDRRAKIIRGEKMPGFGNSFFKTEVDPSFQPVVDMMKDTAQYARILEVQHELREIKNRNLFVNAAGITACAAEILNMPHESQLALPARVAGWLTLL